MNSREVDWRELKKHYRQDPGVLYTGQYLHDLLYTLCENMEEVIEIEMEKQLKRVIALLQRYNEISPERLLERERSVKRRKTVVEKELRDTYREHHEEYAEEWSDHLNRF